MSNTSKKTDVETTTRKNSTATRTQTILDGWEQVQKKVDSGVSEWVSFKNVKTISVKIDDWNIKTWEYTDRDWKPKEYLDTNKGKLAIGERLKRALLPYAKQRYSKEITIEAVGDGLNRQYYVYEVD